MMIRFNSIYRITIHGITIQSLIVIQNLVGVTVILEIQNQRDL